MVVPGHWLTGARSGAAGALLLVLGASVDVPAHAAAAACTGPAVESVVAAIFEGTLNCDRNGDGNVTAADLTAAIVARALPTQTPPPTSENTATPSATPTLPPCPTAGAGLVVEIDNQTGRSPISIVLTGARNGTGCTAGALSTSYHIAVDCSGPGVLTCGRIDALLPAVWRHSIQVSDTGQVQHQAALLIGGDTPNRLRFTAFATVWPVTSTANAGSGSLRQLLQDADNAPKPLLIEFDPVVFPAGVFTTIFLDFSLPALAANDITIDGADATGAAGNRVIDAGGLPVGALSITGARNRITSLRLRNAGDNNRDVLNISGALADGNLVERTIIAGAGTGDGIGVDQQAGKDFGESVNVIRDCDISGASDKGVKVTTGAYARVEHSWVHDNANGGIQATLGGHVQAWHNLVERNRGSTAQNGLSANAGDGGPDPTGFAELEAWGNIARGNGANGISVRAFSVARVRDNYLATNGSSGMRVFNDVGPPASAIVEGTSAVCNGVDGAVVANTSSADFGGGPLGSAGNNAFTQNNLPAGGANLRNATGLQVSAINNQWEHCGRELTCSTTAIDAYDLSDHGANTTVVPAQAHRSQQPPVLTAVTPTKGAQGELLRIFGSGFNVIDGHSSGDQCADVTGRNRCVPLRGNCVRINGVSAPVEAVTPTMLVVRWPFTCTGPVPLVVTTDQGATGSTSLPLTVCTNEAPASSTP